jgi:hypothetical protein
MPKRSAWRARRVLCALTPLVAGACGDDAGGDDSTSGTETAQLDTSGTGSSDTTNPVGSSSSESGDGLMCPDQELDDAHPADVHDSTIGRSDDFTGSCSQGASAPDVAFVWTAPQDGVFSFDTFGTQFDTVLFVLDGMCSGKELACNDDFDAVRQVRQSALEVELDEGQSVTIVVDGFSAQHAGDVELHINGGAGTCPDEHLESALGSVIGSTDTAISASSSTCGGRFAPERSHAFTADVSGTYTFDTFGSSFDTVLYVLDGGCEGRELACNDDVETPSSASGTLLDLDEGQTVTVVVDGAPGQRGAFDLAIGRLADSCPDHDLGSQVPASVSHSTVGAENTTGSSCGGWFSPDVTYAWQAPIAGLYRFDTIGSELDTVLSIREGDCGGAPLACNDDRALNDMTSETTVALQAGQAVTIAVGGKGRDVGSTTLTIEELGCPEIDMGSDVPHTQMGTLQGATDKLSGSCGSAQAPDRALGWTAPADGTYVFDTFGSSFDTVLYALDGDCTGNELACNDDADGSSKSRIVLELLEGQFIVLVIEGFGGAAGSWVLNATAQ